MSDKIPGSAPSNPIEYRGYEIYVADYVPSSRFAWEYGHPDYDGAEDANDGRCGVAASVEECKAQIDELEDDRG